MVFFARLSALTNLISALENGLSVACGQHSLEFLDLDGSITIGVKGVEGKFEVLLSDQLLVVHSGCVELLKVYLAIAVEVDVLQYIVPLLAQL